MFINGYSIGGYWWILVDIGGYWWILVVILLVPINGYSIGGY